MLLVQKNTRLESSAPSCVCFSGVAATPLKLGRPSKRVRCAVHCFAASLLPTPASGKENRE